MALKACLGKRCRAGQINHFVRVTTTNNYLGITSIRVITHFMCLATDIALYMCVYNFPSPFFFFFSPRKKYEESMMVRLNMPKKQKNSKKRGVMSMSGMLSGITHFGDISALTGGEGGQVSLQRHHQGVLFHLLS